MAQGEKKTNNLQQYSEETHQGKLDTSKSISHQAVGFNLEGLGKDAEEEVGHERFCGPN